MEYRKLGGSGLTVSSICLGAMLFGDQTAEAEAERILGAAREAGVNFIDTAEGYAGGRSEAMLGRLLRKDREAWLLATKVGSRRADPPGHAGLSRKWILSAVEGSLKRLATDYIDIYYLHRDDEETPLEETLGALGDLIRAGRIRYWGFSNYFGWRIGEMVRLAERLAMPRPVAAQPYYNAVTRMPEVDYLPACAHYGIGVVPYSPLARGVLTGKYDPDAPPPEGSRAARQDRRMLETDFRHESMIVARRIQERAEARGMTAAQFAFRWVLNNRIVSSVLAGPRTLAQWQGYLGALAHDFTAEDEAFVDSLVPAGHPSTPGYTDPKHPVTGRRPIHG